MTVAILGGGGWGTALAIVLAGRGHGVRLWCRTPQAAAALRSAGENRAYLAGHRLPAEVEAGADLGAAVAGADMVVVAVPVQHIRGTLGAPKPPVDPQAVRVGVAKGLERNTLYRVSEVVNDIWGAGPYVSLSGPSFAAEVAGGHPTAVVAAATPIADAELVSEEMTTTDFRVHASGDLVGVEIAGALKNVFAIAGGMVRGLGHGFNTLAAVLTAGLAEMTRLGVALGGRAETFSGLAGMGDLLLTGTGGLSRNGRVGEALATGRRPEELFGSGGMVAEGIDTALAAAALASKAGVELPITAEVVNVLFHGQDPRAGVDVMMASPRCGKG